MLVQKTVGAKTPFAPSVGKLIRMGNIFEFRLCSTKSNGLGKIKKINKYQYANTETGEVHDYKITENRAQNVGGLKRTFANIRRMINANFNGGENELFVTLTYRENMTDVEKLRVDFKSFAKRLRYWHGEFEYFSVVEPQARGAWHCHVLLKFPDGQKTFIANNEMADIWSHGYTTTRSLKACDNIGAYLTAYLADIELPEGKKSDGEIVEKDVKDSDGNTTKKRFIKGGRCHLYPSGMNIYRCSRGIKKPVAEEVTFEEVEKEVGGHDPVFSQTIEIKDDSGKTLNVIRYFSYNLRRTGKQNDPHSSQNSVHARPTDQRKLPENAPVL